MSLLGRAVRVRVPASSANLGPGFDTFGLALGIYDEIEAVVVDGPSRVEVAGVGAGVVPEDADNLVVRAAARAFAEAGVAMPGLSIRATNVIPHGGGLGSSAAAIVSGIVAASGLLGPDAGLGADRLLALATELEGHPDNVATALLGGLTIAWSVDGVPRAKKLIVHRGVSPLVCVPDFSVSTEHARSLQPASVPYQDAVFNLSRSALLVAALVQSPELLFEATEDRLHQDYRAEAMPETYELVQRLRAAGHAAVVSGAGPSILVLASDPAARADAAGIVERSARSRWDSRMLAVDVRGATVVSLPMGAAD
ncbi:MAG: homoserine kinase [Micrococcales bacterium 73-13]|mgnify:CR=1 FL=1|nr:MAG: homoserine kinase [Micrococcales bacterium 73-13]